MSSLYIDRKGIVLKYDSGAIAFYEQGQRVGTVPLAPIDRLIVRGDALIPANLMGELGQRNIGVLILSGRKNEPSIMLARPHNDAKRRIYQYAQSQNPKFCLAFAQALMTHKLNHQAALLEQQKEQRPRVRLELRKSLTTIENCKDQLAQADSTASLRGLEGAAAAAYFAGLSHCLPPSIHFTGRNRRPPKDPFNVVLSLGYTLIHAEAVISAYAGGLDPYIGFYHELDYGRESLASDLIEPLRPLFDGAALSWMNRQDLRVEDFNQTDNGCLMGKAGRQRFYALYETLAESLRQQLHQDTQSLITTLVDYSQATLA